MLDTVYTVCITGNKENNCMNVVDRKHLLNANKRRWQLYRERLAAKLAPKIQKVIEKSQGKSVDAVAFDIALFIVSQKKK